MIRLMKTIVVFVLTLLARMVLWKYKPAIIAVTGSVGKTSTKDAIFDVLKDAQWTRKSAKSFNSEIGIPLTVLGLENAWRDLAAWTYNFLKGLKLILFYAEYPKVLILEIGADHPGDIRRVTKWLSPEMVVITRLPEYPVHVEYFSSPEKVREEKLELLYALSPQGIFVGNGDDHYIVEVVRDAKFKTYLYGWGKLCDIRGESPRVRYEEVNGTRAPHGMEFTVRHQGKAYPIFLEGVLGAHMCMAVLGALACGVARGESMERMLAALLHMETPRGRMRILQGASKSVIIDDSYNSSPVAAEAALETLKMVEGKRRIAVLGDMLELGDFAELAHRHIGALAANTVDELITVGSRAAWIAEEAQQKGFPAEHIHRFNDTEKAGDSLAREVKTGDVILVKGSQGSGANMIRLERLVRRIMANPVQGEKLLVRQEKEWKRF